MVLKLVKRKSKLRYGPALRYSRLGRTDMHTALSARAAKPVPVDPEDADAVEV